MRRSSHELCNFPVKPSAVPQGQGSAVRSPLLECHTTHAPLLVMNHVNDRSLEKEKEKKRAQRRIANNKHVSTSSGDDRHSSPSLPESHAPCLPCPIREAASTPASAHHSFETHVVVPVAQVGARIVAVAEVAAQTMIAVGRNRRWQKEQQDYSTNTNEPQ